MFDKTPPKGMRDILPEDLLLREKILDTIKKVYRSYGFTGIETPCVEDLGLLTSKQGGDNEKLIFKILKRGGKAGKCLRRRFVRFGAALRFDGAAHEILCKQLRKTALCFQGDANGQRLACRASSERALSSVCAMRH